MGASTSIQPETFTMVKEEYELKKGEGMSDEQLFNHMKCFIEEKSTSLVEPVESPTAATLE